MFCSWSNTTLNSIHITCTTSKHKNITAVTRCRLRDSPFSKETFYNKGRQWFPSSSQHKHNQRKKDNNNKNKKATRYWSSSTSSRVRYPYNMNKNSAKFMLSRLPPIAILELFEELQCLYLFLFCLSLCLSFLSCAFVKHKSQTKQKEM